MEWTRLAIAATISLGLLASAAPAQQGGRRGQVRDRLEKITERLELTESQKAQARAVFEDQIRALRNLAPQMREQRRALQAAVKNGAPDAEIERLAAAVGAVQGQMTAINAKARARFYNILTPEQKQKLDQMRPGLLSQRFGDGRRMGRGMMGKHWRRAPVVP
jgi:Spy/CpxP family protein refolding chaperone